jgi:shikimate dehydrogenase
MNFSLTLSYILILSVNVEPPQMKNFGLIGFPLSHSFSPAYFENKFKRENINANYKAYPIDDIDRYCELIENVSFSGLNVTIPYKEKILPFLDEIDEVAKKIGAVNTIKFNKGRSKGYNTDVFGFEVSLIKLIGYPEIIKGALVLGSGGASHAVCFILDKLNIPHQIVSRNDKRYLGYDDITEKICSDINLIINTTPLGMSPNEDKRPELPYHCLNENYFLYDLIYNPEKTIFLTEGLKRGCKIKNGHDMLILQADKSWEIWNQPEM